MKVVDWRLYDPKNSMFGGKKDKARMTKVLCANSENCEIFKRGACTMFETLIQKCPYGKWRVEHGFTQKARGFHKWIEARREEVKDIPQLSGWRKIANVGEYIYFPYAHWTLDNGVKFNGNRANFLSNGDAFIPKDQFTIDLFQSIVIARPRAIMGGEITSYQEKEVPKIVLHCREEMPEFFREWAEKYPETASRFEVVNHVGRKAYVKTLKVGAVVKVSKNVGQWDGTKMIFEDYKIILPDIRGKNYLEVIPNDDAVVTITDNSQVDEKTKFQD